MDLPPSLPETTDLERRQALRLRQLVEALPVGVWLTDEKGQIVLGNEAGRRIWQGARYVGLESYGQFKAWWPDGRPVAAHEWAAARAITRGETCPGDEVEIECFDGTRKMIRNSATPLRDEAGRLLGALVVNEDLTELKRHGAERERQERALREANERFELAARATKDALWDWDVTTGKVWWNDGYYTLFGYSPADTAPGPESWSAHLHPEDRERVLASVYDVIDGDGQAWAAHYRFARSDGSYANVLDRGFIVRGADGRPLRMLCAMMDVTEREKTARFYASLSAINEHVARASSSAELLQGACAIAVSTGDFQFALVRMLREAGTLADIVAYAGERRPEQLDAALDLAPGTRGGDSLVAVACRTGKPVVAAGEDLEGRSALARLVRENGARSGAAYPLVRAGACIGAMLLMSRDPRAFDGDITGLLERMAASVSHGLETLETGEALRRFRLALDQSEELVALVDRGTLRYIDVNETLCAQLGYSRAELLRMRPDEILPFSRAELERTYDWLIANPGRSARVRGHYFCKDGSQLPYEATRQAVRSGERWVIVSMGRDIREQLAAEAALNKSEQEFRSLAENAPDGIMRFDAELRCVFVNPAVVKTSGQPVQAFLGRTAREFAVPEGLRRLLGDAVEGAFQSGETQTFDYQFAGPRGERHYQGRVAPERGPDGRPVSVLGISRDITDRKRAERAMAESEARLRGIVEASVEPLLLVGTNGVTLFANPAAAALFGRAVGELEGAPLGLPLAVGRPADVHIVLPGGTVRPAEMQVASTELDGHEVLVVSLHDLSERKRFEEHIQHLATHDKLTGLPNRALLGDRIEQAISHARRNKASLALLFIDLDHFKLVNDSFGHAAGDALLVQIGERLRATVREGDTVARLGGDEFVILLTDLAQPRDSAVVAQKIAEALGKPVRVQGSELHVAASIGIALCPDDGEGLESLLQCADAAMYRAKDAGRNGFQYYSSEMGEQARLRVETEAGLRAAIERDELRLHYQPQVNLATGRVAAIEALMRWEHPLRGMVSPASFIPVAEESGLIVAMGQWALVQACRDAAGWSASGLAPVHVSVNLSARQFWRGSVTEAVRIALAESGLPAAQLEVEITESVLARDLRQVMLSLEQLRRMGVSVAIDDFGTGYSSLAYLRSLPIQKLKIDKSFIQGIPADREATALVGEIVRLAHVLSLAVVAEGVETVDQARFLRECGCEAMQGFLFSRPLPAGECAALLRSGRRFVADPPAVEGGPAPG